MQKNTGYECQPNLPQGPFLCTLYRQHVNSNLQNSIIMYIYQGVNLFSVTSNTICQNGCMQIVRTGKRVSVSHLHRMSNTAHQKYIQLHFVVCKSACFSGHCDSQSSAQQKIHHKGHSVSLPRWFHIAVCHGYVSKMLKAYEKAVCPGCIHTACDSTDFVRAFK